ncbi:hypothetical protein L5515_019242 [Caenorhabditis briggsae]|uniref:Uncharacterized protein n=1 Tax=Caenorhabditis briggsae TaxID=6238 RepID=A0AAE9FIV1_CAEBR|nr:hypothetical protein L5515_019242 [Caenorhabditis briggsae]
MSLHDGINRQFENQILRWRFPINSRKPSNGIGLFNESLSSGEVHSDFSDWVAMIIPQEMQKGLGECIQARMLGGYNAKTIAIPTTMEQIMGLDDEPYSKQQSGARKILSIYRAEKFDRRMMKHMIDKNHMYPNFRPKMSAHSRAHFMLFIFLHFL